MTPDQFREFLKDNRESTSKTIKETVNGKIDKMTDRMNKDWARIAPVIEAYETSQRALKDAERAGRTILWVAGFIVAIGSAYLTIKQIFYAT